MYLPQSGIYSLYRLVRLDQSLVMVKGAVGFGQGAAFGQSNTNTLLLDDGASRCKERKSDRKQTGFAQHGEGQCELLGRRRG